MNFISIWPSISQIYLKLRKYERFFFKFIVEKLEKMKNLSNFVMIIWFLLILQHFVGIFGFGVEGNESIRKIENMKSERDALLELWEATNGQYWKYDCIPDITCWNSSTSFCEWVGITCPQNETTVIHLILTLFNLNGFIPPSISSLENLQVLDFSVNYLIEIPTTFGNLANLQTLDLSDNQLTEIPLLFHLHF